MKPKLLLRMASIIIILHDAGHSAGALTWKQTDDPQKQKVIQQMTDHRFPFMGTTRSMAEYFDGYGLGIFLALLLIAALLWIASGHTNQPAAMTRKVLIAVSATLLAWGIDELIFFFPFAAAFSLLAMLLTIIATFQLSKGANR